MTVEKKLQWCRKVSKNWKRPHWRILYYHGVEKDQVASFRTQLLWMKQFFACCSISEGVAALNANAVDQAYLSITFDDADLSVYEHALPVLIELGVSACIYVVPSYVKTGHSFRDPIPRNTMTWSQIRECHFAGMEIGSHTLTHVESARCSDERFIQEITLSKEIIEQNLGERVLHFAYPWGQHNSRTQMHLINSGDYESVATIKRGSMVNDSSPHYLLRDQVNVALSPESVEIKMRLADHLYLIKKLKRERFESYTDRHPEETWGELSPEELRQYY